MKTAVYRFTFGSAVDLTEAETTLQLALLAAEGLFGESRVRMDASYHVDPARSVILVDGSTPTGNAIIRIFTAFVTREFGADAFTVRPLATTPSPTPSTIRTSLGAAA